MENKTEYNSTDLYPERGSHTTQEQLALLKRRIEDLKRNKTPVYIGQPEAKQTDDECYAEIMNACEKFLQTDAAEDEMQLARVLEKHNLQLYYYPPETQEFTKTQNEVARFAFDGVLPPQEALSASADIVKGIPANRGKYKPEDYDFTGSQWMVFRQISEFAELESKLREGLAKKGISPIDLPKLKAHDYCYLLSEQFCGYDTSKSFRFMKESHKSRNTKQFIAEYEEEFRAGMMAMPGVRADYVDALVAAMKEGRTDVSKHRVNGQKVWKEEWKDQPVINVHHIVNVKDSATLEAQGKSWYNVNDYENMCFIVTHPQHQAMHALEKSAYNMRSFSERKRIGKKGYYRIQPPEGVRCMLGFHNMIYDRKYLDLPEKEKAEVKERAEHYPNRVSGSHGRNNTFRGHPNKDYIKDRRDWRNERTQYVRR